MPLARVLVHGLLPASLLCTGVEGRGMEPARGAKELASHSPWHGGMVKPTRAPCHKVAPVGNEPPIIHADGGAARATCHRGWHAQSPGTVVCVVAVAPARIVGLHRSLRAAQPSNQQSGVCRILVRGRHGCQADGSSH